MVINMKVLYIECNMGAAGDMLLSALLELHPEPEAALARLNSLGIPGVTYVMSKSVKCGISGTHTEILVNGETECEHMHNHEHHHHHHSGSDDIEHIIRHLNASDSVKDNALAVYRLIAEAESHAHGVDVSEIHFHEVGTLDAVADVMGVCMLIEELAPDKVAASPVNTGHGTVRCAHGILPVPAPATAYILRSVPVYTNEIAGELCTPTGAGLLKHFVSDFGPMLPMAVEKIGYGMGTRDFAAANCVRAMLGEYRNESGRILELRCNIDDMTGEAVGFATNSLFAEGALDVFTIPIGMKKNRPGILLTCMCREEDRERMIHLIFKHTTTIGIREYICSRYVLERTCSELDTAFGKVRAKKSEGFGVTRIKPEYDDMARLAVENGVSIMDISLTGAEKVFENVK